MCRSIYIYVESYIYICINAQAPQHVYKLWVYVYTAYYEFKLKLRRGAGAAAVCACSPFSSDCMELYKESFCRDKRLWIKGAAACPKRQKINQKQMFGPNFVPRSFDFQLGGNTWKLNCVHLCMAVMLYSCKTPLVCIWKHGANDQFYNQRPDAGPKVLQKIK